MHTLTIIQEPHLASHAIIQFFEQQFLIRFNTNNAQSIGTKVSPIEWFLQIFNLSIFGWTIKNRTLFLMSVSDFCIAHESTLKYGKKISIYVFSTCLLYLISMSILYWISLSIHSLLKMKLGICTKTLKKRVAIDL